MARKSTGASMGFGSIGSMAKLPKPKIAPAVKGLAKPKRMGLQAGNNMAKAMRPSKSKGY